MLNSDVFDFMMRSQAPRPRSELLDDLWRCAAMLGFEHLILSGVPVGAQNPEPLVELNGWPQGWFARYVERGYVSVDSVCLYSARSIRPFDWADVPPEFSDTKGARRVNAEAGEFGIRSGFAVPMLSTRHSWQSVASFGSSQRKLRLSDREKMRIVAIATFAGMAIELGSQARIHLTPREREVLLWAAAGKSAWEIGSILKVSEPAVRKHEKAARRKFGVTTTVQAIVEATRQRLIHP